MKIAISVTEDEKFTEHFGKAQKFLIYEFDGDKAVFLDRRESKKISGEKHQWGKSLKVVEDCNVVICLKIGMTAKPGLKSEGKKVVEDEGTVDEVLNRFVEHEKFMNKPLNF
jgi:predicted Fe-Mo cluster-binding NifX family protein